MYILCKNNIENCNVLNQKYAYGIVRKVFK